MYGFENMGERVAHVKKCVQEAIEIREAFDEQVLVKLQSALTRDNDDEVMPQNQHQIDIDSEKMMILVSKLRESQLHWFAFFDHLENEGKLSPDEFDLT